MKGVKQVIADGANLNAKNERGETPLHNAAVFSRNETTKLRIAKGTDVNGKDDDQGCRTPLDITST